MSAVALVQFSQLDLAKTLQIGRVMLDRNLDDAADAAGHDPPLHHMLCVAAMKNPDAKSANDIKPYLGMFHAGFIIAADERDWTEILEIAGLPCVTSFTVDRNILAGFITGTLLQWQEAVLRGCQRDVSQDVRALYNQLYTQLKNIGLTAAFDFSSTNHPRDTTFLLEYKP